jgi:hypothetical protein
MGQTRKIPIFVNSRNVKSGMGEYRGYDRHLLGNFRGGIVSGEWYQ